MSKTERIISAALDTLVMGLAVFLSFILDHPYATYFVFTSLAGLLNVVLAWYFVAITPRNMPVVMKVVFLASFTVGLVPLIFFVLFVGMATVTGEIP